MRSPIVQLHIDVRGNGVGATVLFFLNVPGQYVALGLPLSEDEYQAAVVHA
jgi:hypothetical protein